MARKSTEDEMQDPTAEPEVLHGLAMLTRSLIHTTGLQAHVDQSLPLTTPRRQAGGVGRVYRPSPAEQPAA